MTSTGGLAGFWMVALLTVYSANLGGNFFGSFVFLYLICSSRSKAVNLSVAFCFISTETQTNSLNEPDVPFPPACPTAHNLAAICHHGQGRPRYPASFFPGSGASHFRRRGNAINRLESWFSLCCSGQVAQQTNQILCCAQQAVSL